MSKEQMTANRPPLVGLFLVAFVVGMSIWMLIDIKRAEGWFQVAVGLFMAYSAYDWWGRRWLVGVSLLAAAVLLYAGISHLAEYRP